ncbi:DUF2975 domain-containing protein [Streptomyces spectabilis]|uniref:DUF2975 domain-containing protein n=1 Tax=Streptomyces spectabilis TaxID=68270 RepID=A0A516R0G1_STRST|nr:DUF2975 domain-containing protein [Streptomyces spectabilis]QDQ09153.1 DUF2975 domain-containing protein [Streptomyces spectabilis]
MNTRLTRTVGSVSMLLAVVLGLAFLGRSTLRLFDDGTVCAKTGFWVNAKLDGGLPVEAGVEASSSQARLCQQDPSFAQRAAGVGDELTWGLFAAVALVMLALLMKAIVKNGPFTNSAAQHLTRLGWAVTLGAPLASLLTGWSHGWLVQSMAPVVGSDVRMDGPLELIVPGLAALILGKIMRQGVAMREDLEGTV